MADANVGDAKETALNVEIPGFYPAGIRLVESFSDGPCSKTASTNALAPWGKSTQTMVLLATSPETSIFAQEQLGLN